ncbi:MAG: hypothetical protein AAGI25_04225 [Bacteroidota bacterium]
MKTKTDKTQDYQYATIQRVQQEPNTGGTATIIDNRPTTIYQRKLRQKMNAFMSTKVFSFQQKAGSGPNQKVQKSSHSGGTRGSSRFRRIAMNMGEKYGVDTSPLTATNNSSFPVQLNAEATIQGNNIHFAPGMDTDYNMRHEVGHFIDNKLNGTPKREKIVNGHWVNNSREGIVDKIAKGNNTIFQRRGYDMPAGNKEPRVVQRKVGMEYETNVEVQTEDENDIGYHVTLFESESKDWKIEADSSSLEFVTQPFNMNNEGRQRLINSVNEMVEWARGIEAVNSTKIHSEDPSLLEEVRATKGTAKNVNDKKVIFRDKKMKSNSILAAPQATGGVTLDQIPMLYESVLSTPLSHLSEENGYTPSWDLRKPKAPKSEDESERLDYELALELHGYNEEIIKTMSAVGIDTETAHHTVAGMNFIDQVPLAHAAHFAKKILEDRVGPKKVNKYGRLQGLLTLVFSYILVGMNQQSRYNYSKLIAPIMSRTNIKKLYETLSKKEKKIFTPKFILNYLGIENRRLFSKGFGSEEGQQKGPRISDWIQSIKDGTPYQKLALKNGEVIDYPQNHTVENDKRNKKIHFIKPNLDADLMSKGSLSDVVERRNITTSGDVNILHTGASSSMGEQNELDTDNDTGEKLAVLELRRLPQNQMLLHWVPTAEVVFDMFMKIRNKQAKI